MKTSFLTRFFLSISALSVMGLAVTGLSACTTTVSDPAATETVASSDADVVAPLVVTIDQIEGQQVALVTGDFLDIDVADGTEAQWTATVSDDMVAQFIPGGEDGSAVTNPGFAALTAGTTTVSMSGGNQTVSFTITVSAR